MKKFVAIALLCAFSALSFAQKFEALPSEPALAGHAPILIEAKGEHLFHRGNFGKITGAGDAAELLTSFTPTLGSNVTMVETRSKSDDLGKTHVRVQQYINGKPVIGSEITVHAESNGDVYAITGRIVDTQSAPARSSIGSSAAMNKGMLMSNIRKGDVTDTPELVYVMDQNGVAFLAWSAHVEYTNEEGPQRDRIFVDASGGNKVVRHPQYHYAKNRRTYDGNNGSSLPGSLARTEGQGATGDGPVDAAHDYAGVTYDYYSSKHGRDSYNNAGATLTSTAHHQSGYNNAFWNGSQMVYGDGDGTTFSPLSESLDVVAHELTHAVTSSESGLIYSYESGALNEALSDIFGAAAEAYYDGGINSGTWKIGDEIYTPGTPGDALRYMNDPQLGGDYDYYPTRYTGSSDNGGVHWNSGIANLAFYLLVNGGTHPRGTTSNTVPAIGMTKAEKIFYRANTVYLSSSSNFQAARNATASAAADLYGSTEVAAVHEAWDAVGVPGGSGGGGGSCSSYTETFTGSLSSGAEAFEPNGTYWYDSNGSTNALLQGPSGTDFDLYLWRWSGSSWVTVAQGTTSTSTETVSYNGSAGYFAYRVHAYSGSGSYTLCVNR